MGMDTNGYKFPFLLHDDKRVGAIVQLLYYNDIAAKGDIWMHII